MATPYISVTDTSTFITTEPATRYDNGHPNSPWRRIAIIPIWSWELGFLAVNTIITGMLIGITESGSGPGKNEVQPWTVLNIVFAIIALVMTCGEVMVFIYHELTPKFFLISTVAKMVVGIIPIGFQIYVAQTSWVHQSNKPNIAYLYTAFGFSIAEYIGYIAALVYGIYVFKNVRNHMEELYSSYSADSESTRLTHSYT
ncbi:hypothetical protein BGZ57DRAFT_900078 [Hyaloscypha finlandica]|nr:hypothetical protein BGZ57DRAFT_900078 [Hyaloscypha finlandica]